MTYRITLFLLFAVQSVVSGDSINIALYSNPFVNYVGEKPLGPDMKPDPLATNPLHIIDGNYFTRLAFPSGVQQSNIGSSFGIELVEPSRISSVAFSCLGNSSVGWKMRVQGYKILAANDTTQWTVLTEGENRDSVAGRVQILSQEKWRYIKAEITSQDPQYFTVLSEFQVFMALDSIKAIKAISFPAPQYVSGESVNEIKWESHNLTPSDKVNIYFKPASSPMFVPLALDEPNDGSFSWNTTVVQDGAYFIKIEPVAAGEILSLTAPLTIQNYPGLICKYGLYDMQSTTSIANFYSSAIVTDSLELQWDFSTKIKKNFHYQIQYSLDSGKSWAFGGVVTDTSKRKFFWKAQQSNITAFYSLFRIEIHIDSVCVASVQVTPPRIVVGGWGFLTVPWSKASHHGVNSIGNTASYRPNNSTTDKIVLGQPWIVESDGDTLTDSFWNKNRYTASLAVSDLDNNGETEIISSAVISESGTVRFYDTTFTLGTEPVVADIQGDGTKEIIYHKVNGFTVVSHEGKKLKIVTVPGSSSIINTVSVADISGDLHKEYVFGIAGTNTVYVFDQSGNTVAGSPITTPDIIQSSPMVADLLNSGENNIIVACKNNIICYNKSGTILNGFPYVVENDVSVKPLVTADIDNDGYLDIIFTTMSSFGPAAQRITKIYCVNRFGINLPGWPATINDSYQHYGIENNGFENKIVPVTVAGNLSSPYVLSIDGDWHNEVIFFSTNGLMYAFNASGKLKNGFPAFVGTFPEVKAHFGDFDNDGSLDAIFPVIHKNVIKMISVDFGPGSYNPARMPWPTYRQNVERTGIAPQPIPLGVEEEKSPIPEIFYLSQNFPNPFNPNTVIPFSLPQTSHATLKVFDLLGREVATLADERLNAGTHQRNFSAARLNSGVYFYTLRAGSFVHTKKMLYLK